MIPAFNLWNPHLQSPSVLSFDATPAEAFLLANGTHGWLSSCLSVFGFPEAPAQWRLKTVRQSYYSEYPESQDWRARWDIAWIVEVTLSQPTAVTISPRVLPWETPERDDSSDDREEPLLDIGPALVTAAFPATANIREDVNESFDRWANVTAPSIPLELHWWPCVDGWVLARTVIEPTHFPERIEALESLYKDWRRFGGLANWRELLMRTL